MDGRNRFPLQEALHTSKPWSFIEPLLNAGADLDIPFQQTTNVSEPLTARQWLNNESNTVPLHPSVVLGMERRNLRTFAEGIVITTLNTAKKRPRL